METPYQLTYTGPRLRGQATTFQQWVIYPLSSNQFWETNAIVKLASNINTGLVDWYRSHLQFTVQTPINILPVGGVQIDSSVFGAINQTVMTHYGYQVQRIMQFDTIMSYLVDVGFSQWVCQSRQSQGLGYVSTPTQQPITSSNRGLIKQSSPAQIANNTTSGSAGWQTQYLFTNGYNPTTQAFLSSNAAQMTANILTSTTPNTYIHTRALNAGMSNSHTGLTNPWVFNSNSALQQITQTLVNGLGRGNNIRAQYKYYINKNQYPDSPDSNTLQNIRIKNQTWNYLNAHTTGYSGSPYQVDFYAQHPYLTTNNAKTVGVGRMCKQNPCGISGYAKPLCGQFACGAFEPMLSPTIPQCQMSYGVIQNTPIPISKRRYRAPLPSSICGVLIPPDQFKLFPCAMYQNLILQLTLNPYWMFSTGYSDVHQFDTTGMATPIKRKWIYNQINWTWHIYTMNNQDLMNRVQAQMYKSIQFSSKYWQLLAQYQLPSGSYVKQTNQIPCNMQSLAQIVIIFLSNQYLKYPFCRKQFRLSNNITHMQLRANTIYYPIQPIVGNAGNPQTIDQTGDNWNFLQLILLSNNFLFSTNTPAPKINKKNFAINGRIYDTSNTKTLYPAAVLNRAALVNLDNLESITITNSNPDTAMGQSWFHQNRYIGKAAFCYTFEPYGHSKTLINGVNTIGWKQFEVTFNNSTINQFPGDQTQYIFGQANIIVKLQRGRPIQVLGI